MCRIQALEKGKQKKNIWHKAKTSDHQDIFKKNKNQEKSKRRSKGGLKPSNRKHLGSDNEIQNFPKIKRSTLSS